MATTEMTIRRVALGFVTAIQFVLLFTEAWDPLTFGVLCLGIVVSGVHYKLLVRPLPITYPKYLHDFENSPPEMYAWLEVKKKARTESILDFKDIMGRIRQLENV